MKQPVWQILDRPEEGLYLLSASGELHGRYAPMYHHRFRLCTDCGNSEDGETEPDSLPARLRHHRKKLGLTQREMAQRAGVSRSVYRNLETGAADCCAPEIADALAAAFGIPVDELLDDYNRFLYHGQGRAIMALRCKERMGKKAFARYLGVSGSSIRDWEAVRKRVSKESWEKHFRGAITAAL